MYASVNWVRIGSGNGLAPKTHQAITCTSADLLSIVPLGTNFSESWIKVRIHENVLEDVVSEMTANCSGGDDFLISRLLSTFSLSGEPDYFGRNKISSGGDLSHYSSVSLY